MSSESITDPLTDQLIKIHQECVKKTNTIYSLYQINSNTIYRCT
jgi:hypothetical protein